MKNPLPDAESTLPACLVPSFSTVMGLTTDFLSPQFTDSCLSLPTE